MFIVIYMLWFVVIHVHWKYFNTFSLTNFPFFSYFQQQIHAQQIPGAPPQPIPALGALGPLGAFAGPMGLPHGPQSLLKAPQEIHREDIKVPLGGPSAEERLVSFSFFLI
jgi:hypothetical protein